MAGSFLFERRLCPLGFESLRLRNFIIGVRGLRVYALAANFRVLLLRVKCLLLSFTEGDAFEARPALCELAFGRVRCFAGFVALQAESDWRGWWACVWSGSVAYVDSISQS